ncbi:MAG TPA: Gfo/Idh/MocA family oxidoreductase, partial [Candidatus Angelobacter sp.]|nr:Gfo/Idh/MocA family oxidoreductase [Candidatus Angelobacter sp.]
MGNKVRVLVVGVGNMGLSHAKAYKSIDGFELVGLMSRSITSRKDLPAELDAVPRFENFAQALEIAKPDAVSINTYPDTHASYALKAFDAGCHVFMEKP